MRRRLDLSRTLAGLASGLWLAVASPCQAQQGVYYLRPLPAAPAPAAGPAAAPSDVSVGTVAFRQQPPAPTPGAPITPARLTIPTPTSVPTATTPAATTPPPAVVEPPPPPAPATGDQATPPPPVPGETGSIRLLASKQKLYQLVQSRAFSRDADLKASVPDAATRRSTVLLDVLVEYAQAIDREGVMKLEDLDPAQQAEYTKLVDDALALSAPPVPLAPVNPVGPPPVPNPTPPAGGGGGGGTPNAGGMVVHILVPNGTTPTVNTPTYPAQTGSPVLLLIPVKRHHLFFKR